MVYRYLFWQEDRGFLGPGRFLRRISLATHEMLTWEMRVTDDSIIKLDCVNKQVYGFQEKSGNEYYISASDYDGGNQTKITSGPFWNDILGVFNGSLYFMNNDRSQIKEMDVSNEIVIRSIAVDRNNYYDLIVVHNSLQPLGKL